MKDNDFDAFSALWADSWSLYGRIPNPKAINLVFEMLGDKPLDEIKRSLIAHCRSSKFPPTAADVIALSGGVSDRLAADEAWALCPRSEDDTVIWTDEIAQAHGIASEILADGDKVGARMAFKAAYERLCADAERDRRPVKWTVSLGYDPKQRRSAVNAAVECGRLTQQQASQYLLEDRSADVGPIIGLLTGNVVKHPAMNKKTLSRLDECNRAALDGFAKREAKEQSAKDERAECQEEIERRRAEAIAHFESKAND